VIGYLIASLLAASVVTLGALGGELIAWKVSGRSRGLPRPELRDFALDALLAFLVALLAIAAHQQLSF
jgi:hypothetical protein